MKKWSIQPKIRKRESVLLENRKEINQLKLLLFCLKLPFFKKLSYYKELSCLLEFAEKMSIPVKELVQERVLDLSVEKLSPDSDYNQYGRIMNEDYKIDNNKLEEVQSLRFFFMLLICIKNKKVVKMCH